MKLPTRLLYCLVLLFSFLIISCSTKSTTTETWVDLAFEEEPFSKMLVIGVSEKITSRNLFEEELIAQLGRLGVEAIPAYEILPYTNILSREIILFF